MQHDQWSKGEKNVARRAFERAYERECAALIEEVRQRAGRLTGAEDLWELHEYLTRQRKAVDEKYDFRYSVLLFVLARLVGDGWLEESELAGLSEDKLAKIRYLSTPAEE